MNAATIANRNKAPLQPTVRSAPIEVMDKRTIDRRRAHLLSLRQYRNSKSRFKLALDVPSDLGFVAISVALLESQVWNSLGIYERRLIDFLLAERLRHGRTANGYLKATYDQLQAQHIPRSYIARTIKNLVKLGLVEVTHQGGHAGGARQNPSLYRLTFVNHSLHSAGTEYLPATNDWIEIELALLDGRRQWPKRHKRPSLKSRFDGQKNKTNLVVINEIIEEMGGAPEISVEPAGFPGLTPGPVVRVPQR